MAKANGKQPIKNDIALSTVSLCKKTENVLEKNFQNNKDFLTAIPKTSIKEEIIGGQTDAKKPHWAGLKCFF